MIMITGATGFVGTQICHELLRRKQPFLRATSRQMPPLPGCNSVIVGRIGPQTDWSTALTKVETVLHLAARVHVIKDEAVDPLNAFRKVNVEGTLNLARFSASAGVKRFVFVSTVKVHGENTKGDKFKETDILSPVEPYAVSKLEAEHGLRAIEKATGMEVVIIRPPLVYGPGVKANFLNLIKWINKGLPLPLGAVDNKRSVIGLTNLADAICLCLVHPKAAGETFLVSDCEDVSTPELIQRIARSLDKSCRLWFFPQSSINFLGRLMGKSGQVGRLCGSLQIDPTKIINLLGWAPAKSMRGELESTAQWYQGCSFGSRQPLQ